MQLDSGALVAHYLMWIPALAIFVAGRWLAGRMLHVTPPLWPRTGPFWRRAVVAVGGSVGCTLATVVLVLVVNLVAGTRIIDPRPTVVAVPEGMPAERAGIRPGDAVLSIDQNPVSEVSDIIHRINTADGPVVVTVERQGQWLPFSMSPVDHKVGMQLDHAGVTVSARASMAWSSALGAPFSMLRRTGEAFTFRPRAAFSGPIGIVQRAPSTHRVSDGLAWQLMLVAVFGQLVALVLLCIPRRKTT